MFTKLALLAVAGSIGTLARYGLATWIQRQSPLDFPFGTLAVNLVGCLLFGIVWGFAERRIDGGDALRLYALVGFMGAFTTFSTFAFDSAQMLARRELAVLALNLALQNGLGIALVIGGLALGRRF